MIRGRLRTRTRADAVANQPRASARRFGRIVYFVLVGAFFIYLLNAMAGSFIFLRAPGIVTSERFVVAANYMARVSTIQIQTGDTIRQGDPVATLESSEMLAIIARLTADRANLRAREQQLRGRARTIEALGPVAQARLNEAERTTKAVASAPQGLTSRTYQANIVRELYEARRETVSMEVEAGSIQDEIAGVQDGLSNVSTALAQARMSYSDGNVAAAVGGIVGAKIPTAGEVYRPGDPLLEILTGRPYVLAYIPTEYFFGVRPGESVIVTDGLLNVDGVVQRVETVADYLPPEFQATFHATEKSQVMRVAFTGKNPFPIHSKVYVRSPWHRRILRSLESNIRDEETRDSKKPCKKNA